MTFEPQQCHLLKDVEQKRLQHQSMQVSQPSISSYLHLSFIILEDEAGNSASDGGILRWTSTPNPFARDYQILPDIWILSLSKLLTFNPLPE